MLKHIKSKTAENELAAPTKNLLAGDDDGSDAEPDDEALWLILTTKKHVVDKKRLSPGKIAVPHPFNNPSSTICLISADPQRATKDTIADPSFPSELGSRITRVIGYSKLLAKYKSFESRRQLLSEHDVFLADDRIITRLPQALGKIFYKGSKKPIPISIAKIEKKDGKKVKKPAGQKKSKDDPSGPVASPQVVAKEVERALNSALIALAPAGTAAVKIGRSGFLPQQVAENVEAVVKGLVDRWVTKGWRNIKALHIKGATTMALPIWLADELWQDEEDVVEEGQAAKAIEAGKSSSKKRKAIADAPVQVLKKRKSGGDGVVEETVKASTLTGNGAITESITTKQSADGAVKSVKKSKKSKSEDDGDLAADSAARKEKLKRQKSDAMNDADEFSSVVQKFQTADGAKVKSKSQSKSKKSIKA